MAYEGMRTLRIPPAFWGRPDVRATFDRPDGPDFAGLFQLLQRHCKASQTRIATACGITQGQVSNILNGVKKPRAADLVERIVSGLAVPADLRAIIRYSGDTVPAPAESSDRDQPRTVLAELVRRSGRTYDDLAAELGMSPRHLARLAHGQLPVEAELRAATRRALAETFRLPAHILLAPPRQLDALRSHTSGDGMRPSSLASDEATDAAILSSPTGRITVADIRRLRYQIEESVSGQGLSEATVDAWRDTIARHGAATRYRSAGPLLEELVGDFYELERKIARTRTISGLVQLTVITAQMAGLVSLTLLKLSQTDESRHWARTARIAADESGDPVVQAWVRAQEAYAHFYAGSPTNAIRSARQAQQLAGRRSSVGVALATALEARAHALLGDATNAHLALDRAKAALDSLPAEEITASAFGYSEAQLAFHEGNTLTHLNETNRAWAAQRRALDLYSSSDYLDRSLVLLDRATCLARDGEVAEAFTCTRDALEALTPPQRVGLVTLRARQLVDAISPSHRQLAAARDIRELVIETKEI